MTPLLCNYVMNGVKYNIIVESSHKNLSVAHWVYYIRVGIYLLPPFPQNWVIIVELFLYIVTFFSSLLYSLLLPPSCLIWHVFLFSLSQLRCHISFFKNLLSPINTPNQFFSLLLRYSSFFFSLFYTYNQLFSLQLNTLTHNL